MNHEILARIRELGGNTDQVKGHSFADDLQAITFSTVLYPRPADTPWGAADDMEPIPGLNDWVAAHRTQLAHDAANFARELVAHFYQLTQEPRGQMFYLARPFTPFQPGTADYEEWHDDFTDPTSTDLRPVLDVVADATPNFLHLAYSYGYPDGYYVCLSDPNPHNPTVFGTDHETFFREVTNEGTLEAFFQRFLTPAELLALVQRRFGEQPLPTNPDSNDSHL
jgi:hypothetical protein